MNKNVTALNILKKVSSIGVSLALVGSISGCAKEIEYSESASSTSIEEIQPNDDLEQNEEVQASSAVNQAIEIMITEAEDIAEATEEYKKTEEYQETKEKTKQNFDDLLGFLFEDEEIAGYTMDDVTDETKDFVVDSANMLDDYIEENVPGYHNRLREKFHDLKEKAEEKGTDIAAEILDEVDYLWDKIQEKRQK